MKQTALALALLAFGLPARGVPSRPVDRRVCQHARLTVNRLPLLARRRESHGAWFSHG